MFITSIIGIILIIGGISLYRTFAMYKIEKTFNVLEGTIPNFSKEYKEDSLNGTEPVITGELVPVKINDQGVVTKANIKEEWYNYANKEWANAVILTEAGKQQNFADNAKIDEQYIESYFVWIPKYQYKIFDMGQYTNTTNVENKNNQAVEIQFSTENTKDNVTNAKGEKECATPMLSNGVQGASGESGTCQIGYWMTHPAFLAFNTTGLWVGKFETGYKGATSRTDAQQNNSITSNIVIKPNQYTWRNINIANSFIVSKNYNGILLSHMMKNTEWGAVAYLTQSIYGRCINSTSCTKVVTNNNGEYVTGYASQVESGTEHQQPEKDGSKTVNYKNKDSVKASTTGNYSGVYDMSGGAIEEVAGVMKTSLTDDTPLWLNSGLNSNILNDTKYYDIYNYGTQTQYNRRILGDATGEMGPFNGYSSYFGNYAYFLASNGPWFYRSGNYDHDSAGVFNFSPFNGTAWGSAGFRIVLAP